MAHLLHTRSPMASVPTAIRRGYTLVELMIVVVIVGVIATLGVYGVRKYVYSSKTAEAIHMIGQIKSAQEAFIDETFTYLDASTNVTSYYPQNAVPSRNKFEWRNPAHGDFARWQQLGVSAKEPVQFGYVTVAGPSTQAPPAITGMTTSPSWPAPAGQWFVVRASADQNGDGNLSYFVASSFTSELAVENEDE